MTKKQGSQKRSRWFTVPELPEEVFRAWRKSRLAISPIAIVATVDPDGTPRTAPFGSLRAVTPRMLRLTCLRHHDTYTNLCHDGRVTVTLLSPPSIAVSVRGRARVARERMLAHEYAAVVEIDIEEVKNDMPGTIDIDSGITISAKDQFKWWFDAVVGEMETMGSQVAQ